MDLFFFFFSRRYWNKTIPKSPTTAKMYNHMVHNWDLQRFCCGQWDWGPQSRMRMAQRTRNRRPCVLHLSKSDSFNISLLLIQFDKQPRTSKSPACEQWSITGQHCHCVSQKSGIKLTYDPGVRTPFQEITWKLILITRTQSIHLSLGVLPGAHLARKITSSSKSGGSN